jgi:superfamily I DNA/RNA helicase
MGSDRERIPKNLFTSHPKSTPVTLKTFSTPLMEASFIATEIKRLIAYSGGVLNYGDFGILCESPSLLERSSLTYILSAIQCLVSQYRIIASERQHTESHCWRT